MTLEHRLAHLRKLARVEVFRIAEEHSEIRRRWTRIRSGLTGRSETRWVYDDRRYRRRVLERVFERDPRIVHVDNVVLHPHLPALEGRRVVLAHSRHESHHLRDRAAHTTGRDRARLVREAEWLARVEERWLPRVTANLVSSEAARAALLEVAPDTRVEIVPPAVDTRHFTPRPGTGQGLAFVGGTMSPANQDALRYFTDEILPRLRRESSLHGLEPISWVGPARPGDRERFRERGIDITGYVEDIRPIVRPSACYIVPRRLAGGRTRVLQAWAMGKAVVSTSAGCQGLAAVDGENILVRDTPDDFARAVLRVLSDASLRRDLGEHGRRAVEAHYGWDRVGREMVALYEELESGSPLGT